MSAGGSGSGAPGRPLGQPDASGQPKRPSQASEDAARSLDASARGSGGRELDLERLVSGDGGLLLAGRHRGRAAEISVAALPRLIDRIGFGRAQFLPLLNICGVAFCSGADIIFACGVLESWRVEWSLSQYLTGCLLSLAALGMASGAALGGELADRYGRERPILASYAVASVVALATDFAWDFKSMASLRFLSGFAGGLGTPAAVSMLGEVFPSSHRHVVFFCFSVAKVLGQIYACIGLCLYLPTLSDAGGWRSVSDYCSIPTFVFLVLSWAFMPKSVHWLIVKGKISEAKTYLKEQAELNGCEDVLLELQRSFGSRGSRARAASQTRASQEHGDESSRQVSETAGVGGQEEDTAGGSAAAQQDLEARVTGAKKLDFCWQSTFKIARFAALISAGNLASDGLDHFWPVVMREEAVYESNHGKAAQGLFAMFSLSSFASVVVFFVSSRSVCHRSTVAATAALLTICCSLLLHYKQHLSMMLYAIICAATVAFGCTFYASSLQFLEESFETQVRSSASGIIFAIGELVLVISPLLFELEGEERFLTLIMVVLCTSTFSVFGLQETSGLELRECVEGEAWDMGSEEDAPHPGEARSSLDRDLLRAQGALQQARGEQSQSLETRVVAAWSALLLLVLVTALFLPAAKALPGQAAQKRSQSSSHASFVALAVLEDGSNASSGRATPLLARRSSRGVHHLDSLLLEPPALALRRQGQRRPSRNSMAAAAALSLPLPQRRSANRQLFRQQAAETETVPERQQLQFMQERNAPPAGEGLGRGSGGGGGAKGVVAVAADGRLQPE
eukprot:TRINITY_DN41644_c0_g1_i2.p1 TRINITY_DN41644_c0_g1~~TRINITY_DN41644_c0_g1_i2.p1  ORF type:complete len:797 (+),score=217.47 TRINITY_DN41644_c0_g1_i2:169-2559(+)